MHTRKVAVFELVLILPAALFMAALVIRELGPLQSEPAHTAQRFVMLYAGRVWTLWVLLLALPMMALVTGCATLLREWNRDMELARTFSLIRARWDSLLVAATTLCAGGILAIVALHMLAN